MKIGNKEIKNNGGYTCGKISHGSLIWTLKEIGAVDVAKVLQQQFDNIKIKDNCKYMEKYREVEKKFFENFGVTFDIIDGEVQIKMF